MHIIWNSRGCWRNCTKNIWFESGLGILSSEFFTCDPLIWLKVKSLSSTSSILREAKISRKFQVSIHFFFKTSKWIIGVLILRIWVVLKTSMAPMTSTAYLASKNQNTMYFTYQLNSLASGTSSASKTSTASMTSSAYQKTCWAGWCHQSWHQNGLFWSLDMVYFIDFYNPLILLKAVEEGDIYYF